MTFNTFEDLFKSNLDPGEIAARATLGEFDHLIDPDSLEIVWDEHGPFVAMSPRRRARQARKPQADAEPMTDAERLEALRADV